MKTAVTGGSGIVGTAVTRRLVADGHDVAALGRSPASLNALEKLGARPVPGDLTDAGSLAALVAGAEVVFHVGGINEMCSLDSDQMWAVNVEGTQNVFEAALAARVGRVVHTSSVVTIGEAHGVLADEGTVRSRPFLSEYEASKSRAEEIALGYSDSIETVVVNPSSVQGPGRATGTGRLLLAAAEGNVPFAIDSVISIVDIEDCAIGHVLAATKGAPGERYILNGSVTSVRQVLGLVSKATGRTVRPTFIKPSVVRGVAPFVAGLFRAVGRQPPLCPESARVLTAEHRYDGGKAASELGLRYTPLETTIDRTIRWFRSEGLL